jgi:hypothetical protein
MLRASLLAAAILSLTAPAAVAQRDIRTERVQFERGATSAVIEDSITDYDIVDYVLGAREGQYMNVSMATDNTGNYFNILAPGETRSPCSTAPSARTSTRASSPTAATTRFAPT